MCGEFASCEVVLKPVSQVRVVVCDAEQRRHPRKIYIVGRCGTAIYREATSSITRFLDESSLVVAHVEASGDFCQDSGESPRYVTAAVVPSLMRLEITPPCPCFRLSGNCLRLSRIASDGLGVQVGHHHCTQDQVLFVEQPRLCRSL